MNPESVHAAADVDHPPGTYADGLSQPPIEAAPSAFQSAQGEHRVVPTELLSSIPVWLRWTTIATLPELDMLRVSRDEMFRSLSLYYEHVKHVIYIMISVPGATLFVLNVSKNVVPPELLVFAGLALAVVPPLVSEFSIQVIRRYYEVYVASLVFATRAHVALGQVEIHPWIDRTISQAKIAAEQSRVDDAGAFLAWRASSPNDTFVGYRRIIRTIAWASSIAGALLVLFGVMSILQ